MADLRAQLSASLGAAFTIERELGGGGMSRVFVAEDAALGRRVVVKVLMPDLAHGVSVERFRREIAIAASLQHPHLVPLLSAGETDGLPYFTMPLIEGESLRARLARSGEFPIGEAVRLLRGVASALAYAHGRGIVHRDIKPENILLSDQHAVVTDLGIAKALSDAGAGGTGQLTSAGITLGTPAYMSPEQAAGDPATDHRADIYAFGVVAYEVLTGQTPFTGRSAMAVIAAHIAEAPEPLAKRRPAVPPALATLVMHCLEKRPADRPQSADEVLLALDAVSVPSRLPDGHAAAAVRLPSVAGHTRRRAAVLAGAVLLSVLVAGFVGSRWFRSASISPGGRASLAVLPMVNTSGDPENEHFADGLTDELIGALSKVDSLTVTGRTSSFALKAKNLDVLAIARMLRVATVLEGTVRRDGDRLRVVVQLLSGADGRVIWSDTYDRQRQDVFAVQEEIARAVVRSLRLHLDAGGRPLTRPAVDLAAYDLYLKGRSIMLSRDSREGLIEAATYFGQAIARDSTYARAYAGLADAHAHLAVFGYGLPGEEFAKAKATAYQALALDSTLSEAHAALAHVLFVHDFEWAAAEREFRRAIALDPSNSPARYIFAVLLQDEARFDEAAAGLEASRAADPLGLFPRAVLGRVYVNARQPDRAIPPLLEALKIGPEADLVYQQLGHAYVQKKMWPEAINALSRAAALSGARDSAHLAYAYAMSGDRTRARTILQTLIDPATHPYVAPFHIAIAYAGLGDVDATFRWLERGYSERSSFMDGVKVTPAFDLLHADPRWERLLRRMGLTR